MSTLWYSIESSYKTTNFNSKRLLNKISLEIFFFPLYILINLTQTGNIDRKIVNKKKNNKKKFANREYYFNLVFIMIFFFLLLFASVCFSFELVLRGYYGTYT